MSALLLALLLRPAPPAPVPPFVRVPPPITTIPAPMSMNARVQEPPVSVAVRATGGGRTLFADTMLVDSFTGASFSQNRSESSAAVCTGLERYDRQQASSFTLRLNRRMGTGDQRTLSVSVTWTRPLEGDPCLGSGNRGATLQQVVALVRGKTVVVSGDGGLRVELTPR